MTSRTEFQDVNKVRASIGTECYGRSLISSLSTSWTQVLKSRDILYSWGRTGQLQIRDVGSWGNGCYVIPLESVRHSQEIHEGLSYDHCISLSRKNEKFIIVLLDRLISSRILSQLSPKVKFLALFTSWYNFFKWAQISDAFLKECRANPLLGSTEFRCPVTTHELFWFHVTKAFSSVGAGMLLSK